VAATPQQVAALAQAQATGRLALSLVGAMDESNAEVIEVDQSRLLGLQARAEPAPEVKEETCVIRTRRGSEVVVTQIPCTN
jgi:pilus assembly protein CpaB